MRLGQAYFRAFKYEESWNRDYYGLLQLAVNRFDKRKTHTHIVVVVVVVVVVVLTLTRIIIKSVVTGQAPVILELRNTPYTHTRFVIFFVHRISDMKNQDSDKNVRIP